MTNLTFLLHAVDRAEKMGDDMVLATVVKVEGSAYRRPGARMLVLPYGPAAGSISGGCLEADVCRKAWWVTSLGPVLRHYSTGSLDEDEDGPACNGKVHVLLERLPTRGGSPLVQLLRQVRDMKRPAALATVIASHTRSGVRVGDRLLLDTDGHYSCHLDSATLQTAVQTDLSATLHRQESALHTYADCQGETELFLEYLSPPPDLVILGAGRDVLPLVHMAKLQGFHVTVVDTRADVAHPGRFPGADTILARPPALNNISPHTAVALMTHNFSQDRQWLAALLRDPPAYIGLLGSRQRSERLLASIREQHVELPGLRVLHAPMGLDLGGDTPESVALAILAELMAVLRARSGHPLKQRESPIHGQLPVHYTYLSASETALVGP